MIRGIFTERELPQSCSSFYVHILRSQKKGNIYLLSPFSGKILRREFPLVPAQYIRQVMEEKKTLFSTYMALSASENTLTNGANGPYERLKKARRAKGNRPLSMEDTLPVQLALERELDSAKKKTAKEAGMLYGYTS